MHYVKNAVVSGTRRIARHVPISMPIPKTIQRHIPMPKVLYMYDCYRDSTFSRGVVGLDDQRIIMAIFCRECKREAGSHGEKGGRGGGFPSPFFCVCNLPGRRLRSCVCFGLPCCSRLFPLGIVFAPDGLPK